MDSPNVNNPSSARLVALLGILAPAWFSALVLLQEFLQPDYSRVALPISALAAWPYGWIQVLNFLATGTSLVFFAWALHRAVRPSRQGALGTRLIALGGVGIVIAGMFSWRMIDGVPTETGGHVVGAVTTFAASALGLVVFSRRMATDPEWRDLATYTTVTGLVMLALFVVVGFFAIDDGAPFHAMTGVLQRLLCVIWFACLVTLGLRARRVIPRG